MKLATLGHRYGGQTRIRTDSELTVQVRRLARELFEEEFEEPDDEHVQIYVTRADELSVSASVSGRLRLDDLDDLHRPTRYHVVDTEDELVELLIAFVRGELDLDWPDSPDGLPACGREFRRFV